MYIESPFTSLRWYQIKISMRWEDGDNNNNNSSGIPSRVVQYEGRYSSLHHLFVLNHLSFVYLESFFFRIRIYMPFVVTALDSTSNDTSGVWKIDDKDNSFLSQPFRIKYARQDVRLCMMVSFTMPLERFEVKAFFFSYLSC